MTKCFIIVMLLLVATAFADVPHLLNVQGLLTDNAGDPLDDGSYSVVFKIYNASSGGSVLWTEARSVATVGGLFTIYLGQSTPLPASVFSGVDLWLGIAVEGEAEMTPRQRITTVPYVYRAIYADSSSFASSIADNSVTSSKIANGSIQMADIGQNGASTNQVIKWNGSAWAAANDETGSGGGGWVDDGAVVRLSSSGDKVGIGTTNPQEKLEVNGDIRLGSSSDIAFGSDNNRMFFTGGDMVLTADDDIHIQPDDDIFIRKDGGTAWIHIDNSLERLGVGTTNPSSRLEVDGSLKVTGAFKGDITSTSGTTGAPFPRPAYNSGWVDIGVGESIILTHNIGGLLDDYVIDLQVFDDSYYGVTNSFVGRDRFYVSGFYQSRGVYYSAVTSTTIRIERASYDNTVESFRVRIWVIE